MGDDEHQNVVNEVDPKPELLVQHSLVDRVEKTKVRSKSYVLDLKINTPSSLLGTSSLPGIDAAPALVRLALVKGLDVIAMTDRNSGAFVDRIARAAQDSKLTVIPGVEIRCEVAGCRDIIITCLFPEHFTSTDIEGFLRGIGVPPGAKGDRKFLVPRHFDAILAALDDVGGAALPSRVDKTPHRVSVIPTLVEEYGFRAFDLAFSDSAKIFSDRWPKQKFALFSFSNASALAQVGSRNVKVKMPLPGYEGVRELVKRVVVETA